MKWPGHFQKIIGGFIYKNPRWVCTTFFLMMLNFPIELIVLSYLSGRIFVSMADMKTNYNKVIRLIMYFFFAYFTIEISLIMRDSYDSFMVPELEREIRNHIIMLILEKNEIQFDNMAMGEIVTRFLKAPIHSFYAYGILTKFIVPFMCGLIIIGFYIMYLNLKLGGLYFLLFACYLCIFSYLCWLMIQQTNIKMIREMAMFNSLEDTLGNMQTIFTSDTVQQETLFMDDIQVKFNEDYRNELQLNARVKMIMSVVSLLTIFFLFMYSIHLYKKDEIINETLISIVTLLLFMCRFLGYTARRITEGMITIGSIMESNSFLEQLQRDTFSDGTRIDFIMGGKIEFENVNFRYSPKYPWVLESFSLEIPARSRIVLIGDSGSGKTTFIRLLLGFFQMENGRIMIDDVNINHSRRSYLRHKIAYINQTTRLFDRSILENILYGCDSSITRQDVKVFMEQEHLTDIFHNVSTEGLDTRVGRGGDNLSGGMRQIILLMRCYFRNAPIVILDEATSSIDARHRKYAIVIIKKMFEKSTVIAVSHDQDITDLFSQRLVFSISKPPQLTRIT